MHGRVELLLASAQTAAHDLLEARGAKLRAELIACLCGRQRCDQAIQQIEVGSEIVSCIPFDATDVWGSGHRRARRREVSLVVRSWIRRTLLHERVVRLRVSLRQWDHVEMVQEDPEDFFGHISDLLAPHAVRP